MADSRLRDQDYLVRDQYRDASKLEARIQLYRFRTNPLGWYRWLFDHFDLPANARVLEVGCGPGTLWSENVDRIPAGWEITLGDLSPGMLDEARRNLRSTGRQFAFAVLDAQSIPYENDSFDAAIANSMLYHVPDRARAIAELRRIVRPGGRLYASTLSRHHLRELTEVIDTLVGHAPYYRDLGFDLEHGGAELARSFERVEVDRFRDALVVTELEPLLTYLGSNRARSIVESPEKRAAFITWVESQMAQHGAVRITTDSGLFQAW